MEQGKIAEQHIETLEKRRRMCRYHLPDGRRLFHVRLHSDVLGLSGTIDLLIETQDAFFPVDFKNTFGEVSRNHRAQLCGYAMLVEDAYRCCVPKGFVYVIPRNRIETVEMTEELRAKARARLDQIRAMITAAVPPQHDRISCTCVRLA